MLAQIAPNPENLSEFFGLIVSAVGTKNYGLLIALAVVLIVYLARKFGAKYIPWLGTSRGGFALSLGSALGLSVFAAATAEGQHSLVEVLKTALLACVSASGTWSLLKNLLFPTGSQLVEEIKAVEPKVEETKVSEVVAGAQSATDVLKGV